MSSLNDSFDNRFVLTGVIATDFGSNFDATGEIGEPNHAGVSGTLNSLWWSWTAPFSGTVRVNTAGSNFDTTLGVYTGNSVSSLTNIGSNDDYYGLTSLVNFSAVAGTTYQIAVDGYSTSLGNINLAVNYIAPSNDNFDNRSTLLGTTATAIGSNFLATGETGEPIHADNNGARNSVWWSWTAPFSGNVTVNTAGSNFDTTLGIYTGNSVSSLNTITTNDDYNGITSLVNFSAIAGTTYQIAVDGYFAATGNINLALNYLPPNNDNFANRSVISGWNTYTTGTNIAATGELNEPNHAYVSGTLNSVWWSWTASRNGYATINTFGSNFDTTLAVYTGSSVSDLTTIGSNDDYYGLNSLVSFNAVAGTTYQIAVDGYSSSVGNINLAVDFSTFFIPEPVFPTDDVIETSSKDTLINNSNNDALIGNPSPTSITKNTSLDSISFNPSLQEADPLTGVSSSNTDSPYETSFSEGFVANTGITPTEFSFESAITTKDYSLGSYSTDVNSSLDISSNTITPTIQNDIFSSDLALTKTNTGVFVI
jgi:hypothetical protein